MWEKLSIKDVDDEYSPSIPPTILFVVDTPQVLSLIKLKFWWFLSKFKSEGLLGKLASFADGTIGGAAVVVVVVVTGADLALSGQHTN